MSRWVTSRTEPRTASLVLGVLAPLRAVVASRAAARIAWLLVGVTLLTLFLRLVDLGLLSATVGLDN